MIEQLSPAQTWLAYAIVCLAVVGTWTVWTAATRAAYRAMPAAWRARLDAFRRWLEAPDMSDDADDDGPGWGSGGTGEDLAARAYLAYVDRTWDEDLTGGNPR